MSLDSIELSDSDFDDVMSDGLAELLKGNTRSTLKSWKS